VLLGAVLIVLAGCSGSGSPRPAAGPASVPDGYTQVRDPESGFSLAIPPEWRRVALDAATLQQEADAARTANPGLADTLSAAKDLVGNGGRLLALSPDGSANVNVIVTAAGDATLDDIPGPAVDRLRQRGAVLRSEERTTVAGVPCVKLVLTLPPTPDGTATSDKTQYYALAGGRAYVLTLTGHDPALELIANSLQIG
jgi:hypothetical protein